MADRKSALNLIADLIILKKRQAEIDLAHKQARQRHFHAQAEQFDATKITTDTTDYAVSLQHGIQYYNMQQARAKEMRVKAVQLDPEIEEAKSHLSYCFKQEVAIGEMQQKVMRQQMEEQESCEEAVVEALILNRIEGIK